MGIDSDRFTSVPEYLICQSELARRWREGRGAEELIFFRPSAACFDVFDNPYSICAEEYTYCKAVSPSVSSALGRGADAAAVLSGG